MESTTITESVFQLIQKDPETKVKAEGFAQNVNALVSLIEQSMASKPICSIVTPQFSPDERREFFAQLGPKNWTTQITLGKFKDENVEYPYYLVRTVNLSQDLRRAVAA